jgi:peptidoglycan/LPS O-acetylase OafA/YrhL
MIDDRKLGASLSTSVMSRELSDSAIGGRRRDIQAMRGAAVLLVVLYHAGFGAPKAGFLGVDIFFVISGFLIGGNILKDLRAGRFRFVDFYWRRARRILPAASVVLLVTFVVSFALLASSELHAFQRQLLGALTFTANIALWRQSGYFDGASETKPLLHMWSLSIEEQFYLLVPIALWITPSRLRLALLTSTLSLSLALCLAISTTRPSFGFYMLPTRAWELLIGAAAAAWMRDNAFPGFQPAFGFVATVTLFILPFFPLDVVHPRGDAMLICVASVFVIGSRPTILDRSALGEGLAWVGDISYSLYLVHWPLFAFLHVVYLGDASWFTRASLIVVSFGAAMALHRFVEAPFRRLERPTLSRLAVASGATIALIMAAATAPFVGHRDEWARLGAPNKGLSESCDFDADAVFVAKRECATSTAPSVLVWGDSFAMHLTPGLVAIDKGLGIVQATKSACGPILGSALVDERHSASWARSCLSFNSSVLEFLRGARSVRYVILSSPFGYFTDGSSGSLLTASGRVDPSLGHALEALTGTVHEIMALGKTVVLVAPPPYNSHFNSFRCVERASMGLFTIGAPDKCEIDLLAFQASSASVSEMLRALESRLGIRVVWLQRELCDERSCATQVGGAPIYRDAVHLSHEGSRIVFQRLSASGRLDFLEKESCVAKGSREDC